MFLTTPSLLLVVDGSSVDRISLWRSLTQRLAIVFYRSGFQLKCAATHTVLGLQWQPPQTYTGERSDPTSIDVLSEYHQKLLHLVASQLRVLNYTEVHAPTKVVMVS